ncbi:hypothetical protein L5515_008177 [Caenorhabditis briggsae]|uniref:Uncharacterized protein n=2 Tax=Caenorhabditis briggsae TaxID=6238 RepID=A0AAE9JM85_CAEBR|nr:hypothetical protein L5515_008177 [Caenorhabditis briggsae]
MQINLVWFLLSPLFIEVESPEYRGCAEFQNEFEYCEKKRDQCLSETIETVDCDEKREKCFKENVGDSNCTIEYESNRRKRKQENMENTQIPPMKTLNLLLKNLRNPINDVVKNCSNEDDFENQKQLLQKEMDLVNSVDFSEFSRLKMPTAIIFNALIRNQSISETCKQSLKEFEKKLAILDSAAFSIIPIPFAHWHCGWAYGDVGRVNLRLYASIATRNFAMNFNHVCAIQRDCYMNRKKRKTCDQMFKNSIHGIVNSLKRNKKGAEEFKEILMELSDWKSEYAYSIANLTESSYSTYSENSEGAFTNFNYYYPMNKTAVVFLELKEQPKIKTNLDNLYPCCKFHRIEVSSCLHNYMNSYEDISKCLSNIVTQDKKCLSQLQKAKRVLERNEENQTPWYEWLRYMLEISYYLATIATAIYYCLQKYRDKYRRVSTSEPNTTAD